MSDKTEPQGVMAADWGGPNAGSIERKGPLKCYPTGTVFVGSAPSDAPHWGCNMLHVLQSIELEVGGLDVRAMCGYAEKQLRVVFMPTKSMLLCEECERLVKEQK